MMSQFHRDSSFRESLAVRRHRASTARLKRFHPGLSLAEVLVATGILAVICSLILPAIEQVRESARRIQCGNNLHQLGIALHNHESAHGAFPRGGDMARDGTGGGRPRAHAPHVYLLPHLDQTSLFGKIDLFCAADRGLAPPTDPGEPNALAMQTIVPAYLCPSDPHAHLARNSYRANIGITPFPRSNNPLAGHGSGAFFPVVRALRVQEYRDGLSMTVGFSERLAGDFNPARYSPWCDYFDIIQVAQPGVIAASASPDAEYVNACASLRTPNPRHESGVGAYWFYAGVADTWYAHLLTPNHHIPDCGDIGFGMFNTGVITARSAHTGGVHSLFMDGHGRFISDLISADVWQAIGTRNGSEQQQLD